MPWWTTLLIALGGLLVGGSYSVYQQKGPKWLMIAFAVLGVMAIVAGFLNV